MAICKLEKATLSKTELMAYLGIGETKLNRLLTKEDFPKKKLILDKWSRAEIENWLNKKDENLKNPEELSQELEWKDYFYEA